MGAVRGVKSIAVLFASTVVAGLALAGCGGASATGGGTLLGRTLGSVSADPALMGNFVFADIAALRQLAGVPPSYAALQRTQTVESILWAGLIGAGVSYFQDDPAGTRDGLDVLTGDVALAVGQPPHTAAMISGPRVDTGKVRAALVKLGARPGTVAGQSGLVWGAEGSVDIQAANAFGIGPSLGQFDRTVLTTNRVVAGRYSAEVRALLGGGNTLAKEPAIAATIACLGDVVAAVGIGSQSSGTLSELAAGVPRPSSTSRYVTEVLCAVPAPAAVAAAERVIRSRVSPTAPPFKGFRPLEHGISRSVIDDGTTDGRRWIRATVTDLASSAPGLLINLIEHRYLVP